MRPRNSNGLSKATRQSSLARRSLPPLAVGAICALTVARICTLASLTNYVSLAPVPWLSDAGKDVRPVPALPRLPTFDPLPSKGSACGAPGGIAPSCGGRCDEHERPEDGASGIDNTDRSDDPDEDCRMLWFAALHEDDRKNCGGMVAGQLRPHHYNLEYSTALNSALANARGTLQPVLVLGRHGLPSENSTAHGKIGAWAEGRGARVVYSSRLSFQEDAGRSGFGQGTFLRLDVPRYVREHGLFDMPGVCGDHVLYTDVDVLFANPITRDDIRILRESVGTGVVAYGRESYKNRDIIWNAGVMVINVERFEAELPHILKMARDQDKYPNDQDMLNLYRKQNDTSGEKIRGLGIQYNWKVYWKLEPTAFSEVKILHFQGPKPSRGLEEIAHCNVTAIDKGVGRTLQFGHLLRAGMCCDQGRTALWSLEAIERLSAPLGDVC